MIRWLVATWYKPHPIRWLISPLSALYRTIITLRKWLYRLGLIKQSRLSVPVIIIGNITAGGTGKTPVVIWLSEQLKQAKFKPGIVSRGYGGAAPHYPIDVKPQSNPDIVGDEPVVIRQQTNCPVAVSPNRIEAGYLLLKRYDCDVIIADDGLQHLALARDIEMAVIDGERLFGNGCHLPAGPLREPLSRLNEMDFVIYNEGDSYHPFVTKVMQGLAINLADKSITKNIADFNTQAVHAIAGIANPDRFFNQLKQQGLTLFCHPFCDHHRYQRRDLIFDDTHPILMTEKDAVKCQSFASKNMWYIPISITISGDLGSLLINKLKKIHHG